MMFIFVVATRKRLILIAINVAMLGVMNFTGLTSSVRDGDGIFNDCQIPEENKPKFED